MRILYIQYANPGAYPPLHHSGRILAEAGCEILFLGIAGGSSASLSLPEHDRITVRRLRDCKPGIAQKLHYAAFCIWTWWHALRWRPDWIYASDPFSCPAARVLLLFGPWRLLYHEHDSPNPDGQKSVFEKVVLKSRAKVGSEAAVAVLPNANRIKVFEQEAGRRGPTVCVWNCPLRSEARVERTMETKGKMVFFYHGTIVPARMPLTVLRALAASDRQAELRIMGYETIGHRGYLDVLRCEVSALGIQDRVQFLPALPREAALQYCREADVGLSLMPLNSADRNEQDMAGASNKPFDYMACGLALLVSDLPEWNGLYVHNSFGRACDPGDPRSIAAAIDWFISHPDETRLMGGKGRKRILSEWNYETQFAPVEKVLLGEWPDE